jgi:hypothetical protein
VRTLKKSSERGALTLCQGQREGQVRTPKERRRVRGAYFLSRADGGTSEDTKRQPVRGTHLLSRVEGGTSQDTARKSASEGNSLPVKGRVKDMSRHRKKVSEQGELTNYRSQRKGQVKTPEQSQRKRDTYSLSRADGATSDDTKRKPASEGHSLPVDDREKK